MPRRIDPVSARLAAQSHKLQIVKVQAADSFGVLLNREMASYVARVIRIVEKASKSVLPWTPERTRKLRAEIESTFATMMRVTEKSYYGGLRDFTETAHEWSVEMLIRGIPRWYFRSLMPTAIIGEKLDEPRKVGFIKRVFTIAKRVFNRYVSPALEVSYAEPVASGERMSDAEWQGFLKETIFPPLTAAKIEQIVDNDQWRRTFPGNVSKFNDPAFQAKLVRGIADGEDVVKLTRSIRSLEAGVYYKARRTARTEALRVAEASQRETWDDLGDMLDGLQYLAVLDENTRPEHAALNGQVYVRNPGAGELPIDEAPDLPSEPNCRCTLTPILVPPDEVIQDPALNATFQNAGGKNIPDPAAYDVWFNQADEGARKLAVGSGRYNQVAKKLGNTRRPEWTDFIDPETGSLLGKDFLARERDADREERKRRAHATLRQREALIREIAAKGYISR